MKKILYNISFILELLKNWENSCTDTIPEDTTLCIMISKEKVLKNPRMSQALLGVSEQEFKTLCVPFGLAYLSLKEEIKHNFTKGRKSILQDIEENLFFISKLIRLTTYY